MFYDELDRLKFSQSDQYWTVHVSIIALTIFKIQSYLCNATNKKNYFKKITNQIIIHYPQSVCILHFSEFGFVIFKVPRKRVTALQFS